MSVRFGMRSSSAAGAPLDAAVLMRQAHKKRPRRRLFLAAMRPSCDPPTVRDGARPAERPVDRRIFAPGEERRGFGGRRRAATRRPTFRASSCKRLRPANAIAPRIAPVVRSVTISAPQ
ncbi:hypothetical protein [Roseiarcus fermentans]|uniref:hypothetical protein n=1 Tax=Roseiarcus fermentans TaxID=1473586 RepID=UPI0011BE9F5E|nr:hypothetical protein [Roseiarcus fermentans]